MTYRLFTENLDADQLAAFDDELVGRVTPDGTPIVQARGQQKAAIAGLAAAFGMQGRR